MWHRASVVNKTDENLKMNNPPTRLPSPRLLEILTANNKNTVVTPPSSSSSYLKTAARGRQWLNTAPYLRRRGKARENVFLVVS